MAKWAFGTFVSIFLILGHFAEGAKEKASPCPKILSASTDTRLILGANKALNFSVKVAIRGRPMTFKGNLANEAEVRIRLPDRFVDPYQSQSSRDFISPMSERKPYVHLGMEGFIRLLFRYSHQNTIGPVSAGKKIEHSLELKPLDRKERSWHGSLLDSPVTTQEQFFHSIVTRATHGTFSGDSSQTSVRIAARHELSRYFDTPQEDLKNAGVAVRLKTWFPYRAQPGKEQVDSSGTSLFIKVEQPNSSSAIHTRRELQLYVPEDLTDDEVSMIAFAVLKKLKLATPKHRLQRSVQILNRRFGVKLFLVTHQLSSYDSYGQRVDQQFNEDEVGFAAIDSFLALPPSAPLPVASEELFLNDGVHHQIELEFLPEQQKKILNGPVNWDLALQQFAARYGGQLTKIPKAVTGVDEINKRLQN